MYLDGLEQEELIVFRTAGAPTKEDEQSHTTLVSEEVHRAGSTTITDRTVRASFSGVPGEMAAFGFKEQTIG